MNRYFIVDQEKKESAFRGRKLFDTECELPEGYQGAILQISKDNKPSKCIGKCEKIHLWEQDGRKGTREIHKTNILNWIEISNVVSFFYLLDLDVKFFSCILFFRFMNEEHKIKFR